MFQSDVGDVRTPHLIGAIDEEMPQEVGIDAILDIGDAEVLLGIQGGNAHNLHQGAHSVASDGNVIGEIEFGLDTSVAKERVLGIQGVDDVHGLLVFFGDAQWLVVEAGAWDSEEFALSCDSEVFVVSFDAFSPLIQSEGASIFFSSSRVRFLAVR